MRAVIQRVRRASVEVDGQITGKIDRGVLVFLGVGRGDGLKEVRYFADKIIGLRIFADRTHGVNVSLAEIDGKILLVSQFTLYGDCRRGRRPSFEAAAEPDQAREIYEAFSKYLAEKGFPPEEGIFAASMSVNIENDGPVTILLDSATLGRKSPKSESSKIQSPEPKRDT